jgi:hypothetical protein
MNKDCFFLKRFMALLISTYKISKSINVNKTKNGINDYGKGYQASIIVCTLLIIFLSVEIIHAQKKTTLTNFPAFKITWINGTTYGLLFDKKLTDNDFEKIIYELREIRKRSDFNKYFPVHTAPRMAYKIMQFNMFTDPKWAAPKMNDRFMKNKMSKKETQSYFNNIRGFYGWSQNSQYEKRSIGDILKDKFTDVKSNNYRVLF